MSFREFMLKSYAYNRIQKEKLRHTRFISYFSLVGSHYDPKRLPRSLENFFQIDGDKEIEPMSDDMREMFRKEMAIYEEAVARANNTTT